MAFKRFRNGFRRARARVRTVFVRPRRTGRRRRSSGRAKKIFGFKPLTLLLIVGGSVLLFVPSIRQKILGK